MRQVDRETAEGGMVGGAEARLEPIPVVFGEDFQDGRILKGVRFAHPFTGKCLQTIKA